MEKYMENTKKESLGFIYGYKDTEQVSTNKFVVKTMSGVSKKYPKKLEKKKDFYATEIFVGDTFELFYNTKEFIDAYTKELKQIIKSGSYYNELYEERKYNYAEPITKEQYFALTAFDYVSLNFMGKSFANDEQKSSLLQETVGQFFSNTNAKKLDDIYTEHKRVCQFVYEQELDLFFNEMPKVKKPSV